MAAFRARHQIPDVHMGLYKPVFDQYSPRYAPGLFTDYQLTSLSDAKTYLDGKNGWK